MKKKVAVILSGSGYKDGAEITESVSSLVALDQNQLAYECFAPNKDFPEVDHLKNEETGQKRNILKEAARIARGKIRPLTELNEKNFDAVLLPGGFGAAKNLSDFASKGSGGHADKEVASVLEAFYAAGKPIAAFCIAPAVVALTLGKKGVSLTIGNDPGTAKEIEKTGAKHVNCKVDEFYLDNKNKIITSPAYMYDDATPGQVFAGIGKAVTQLRELLG